MLQEKPLAVDFSSEDSVLQKDVVEASGDGDF